MLPVHLWQDGVTLQNHRSLELCQCQRDTGQVEESTATANVLLFLDDIKVL